MLSRLRRAIGRGFRSVRRAVAFCFATVASVFTYVGSFFGQKAAEAGQRAGISTLTYAAPRLSVQAAGRLARFMANVVATPALLAAAPFFLVATGLWLVTAVVGPEVREDAMFVAGHTARALPDAVGLLNRSLGTKAPVATPAAA
jgi:hypothetical protein